MKGDFLNERLYSVGRAVVDRSFHTQSGNEAFFAFFGNDVTYSIRRTICDEDYPRILECMENASVGNLRRTVIRMKSVSGELRWILVTVRLVLSEGREPMYSMNFSDVFSLESLAYSRQRRLSEYRHVLSLISDLAF